MPEKDTLPDVRVITITMHPDNDYDPELDLDTDVDPWAALGILTVVTRRLRDELCDGDDDDEDD